MHRSNLFCRPAQALALLLFLLLLPASALGAQAQLAWNQGSDGSITGYKVYHGTASRNYSAVEDAGTNLSHTVSGIPETAPYYFAVTAYSAEQESGFSDELTCYVINASASSHGQVQPGGSLVLPRGGSQTYSMTPDSGYAISDVLVDGVSVGPLSEYTFADLSGCHAISAQFTPVASSYTIAASAGSGGSISPSGPVAVSGGGSKTFAIIPSANFSIADVKVDGASVGPVASYTFTNVSANHAIAATFAASSYTITASAGSGGSISPSGPVAVSGGGSKTFAIIPSANFSIADVKVDGASVGPVASYTFTNVSANHAIAATFAASGYTITASAGSGGSISPSGPVSVSGGGSKTFAIIPSANFSIADVKVDGASVGPVASYTFTNVSANHAIAATFAATGYTITASAGSGGSISPSGSVSVSGGGSKTFAIIPSANFSIADVKVDGASVGPVASYTFTNVSANHAIAATFAAATQSLAVDAGSDQTVAPGSVVTLNGSNSRDPVNGIASYKWVQTGGTRVYLSHSTAPICTFTAPKVFWGKTLAFRLTVTSKSGATATDSCLVNVSRTNQAPTARAGSNQTVSPYTIVTLDGSGSSDPDDGIATYKWVQESGPTVTVSNSKTAQATFVAPDAGPAGATLGFLLTVTDYCGQKTTSRCLVSVIDANQPPVADAGRDQTRHGGDSVVLNGSRSHDPDGDVLSFRWKQVSGTPVTLSDPASRKPRFTAPDPEGEALALVFSLTVTDPSGVGASSECTVTVAGRAGADLTGSWTSLSYSRYRAWGSLKVRNTGTAGTGKNMKVTFYLSSDGNRLGSPIATMDCGSIGAGKTTTLYPMFPLWRAHGKYVAAVIDSGDSIPEVCETNNRAAARIP